MKRLSFLMAVLTVLFALAGSPQAAVIDFEDLYTRSSNAIPDGYKGFNWSSAAEIWVKNGPAVPGSGYDVGTVSGEMVAFNAFGLTPGNIDLAETGTFDFNGAYFTSAWHDQTISFKGYDNGSLLYTSSSYSINTTSPQWIELNWAGIDRLQIHSTNLQWVMDDFTYTKIGPVPEPAALPLLCYGLAGLAFVKVRRQTDSI